jgi:hypothetical protein
VVTEHVAGDGLVVPLVIFGKGAAFSCILFHDIDAVIKVAGGFGAQAVFFILGVPVVFLAGDFAAKTVIEIPEPGPVVEPDFTQASRFVVVIESGAVGTVDGGEIAGIVLSAL